MIKNWSLTQNLRTAHRKRGKKPRNYTKLLACKHCEMWKLADVSPAGVCYPPTPGPRVKCPLSLPWGTNTGRHGNILHSTILHYYSWETVVGRHSAINRHEAIIDKMICQQMKKCQNESPCDYTLYICYWPPPGDHHQTVIRGECLLTPGAESRAIAEMSRLQTSVKRSGNLVILRKRGESNIC